ncbi:hypothetical protein H0H87_011394 [Tephrocybe sp. NHM501043]|nr:hypothetical protein H0H87_011394 [Tephrocybe sp. NHM501043]
MSTLDLVRIAKEADTVFKEIPIIDLANISNNDPHVQRALAAQVRDACINVGFFYGAVTMLIRCSTMSELNEQKTLDDILEAAKKFFALPSEAKMEIENRKTPNFKGYSPLLSGNNNPDNAGDLQEGFEFGWEPITPSDADDDDKSGVMAGANVWPTQLPELRNKALAY